MPDNARYNAVAIGLHWLIAAAILSNLILGLWMSWAIDSSAAQAQAVSAFQLHKAIGLSVLVLSLLRLAWRFLYPPPALPAETVRWQRTAATLTHWALYGLMIAIPLSGWLYVSAQWRGDAPFNIPTLWFGLFEVPQLFGLSETSATLRRQFASAALDIHGAMALAMVLLLLIHIGAALKHRFIERDGVLERILPWLATAEKPLSVQQPQRAGFPGIAAATATLVLATLFIAYATSTNLAPGETAQQPAAATVLSELVGDHAAQLQEWRVEADRSQLRFSGVHAGRIFRGHFRQWHTALHFDPQNLEQSTIVAIIETDSATTGVSLHDRSLPQSEWFDVANHPYASYHSTKLRHLDGKRYELQGTLTIKAQAVELPPFTLVLEDDSLRIQGRVELDRADVDMGMASDPGGQYVSRKIDIHIDVRAKAQ